MSSETTEIKMAAVSAKRTTGKMRVRQWVLVVCTHTTFCPSVMPGSLIRLRDNWTKTEDFVRFSSDNAFFLFHPINSTGEIIDYYLSI